MHQKYFVAAVTTIGLVLGASAIYVFLSVSKDTSGVKAPLWSILHLYDGALKPSIPVPDGTESCEDDESLIACHSNNDCLVVGDFHATCACPTAINRNRSSCWSSLGEKNEKLGKELIEKDGFPEIQIECQPCLSPEGMKAICENRRCKAVGPGYPNSLEGKKFGPEILEP